MMIKLFGVGDLVTRGELMFLVLEVGTDYHDGYMLCRCLSSNAEWKEDHWILKSILRLA